ncbi:testican-3 [Neoarius graeffei]|uniref:testican-3 n=1 Tax=Neoarius graeffei TaxID=443677 RepID=UPI00298CE208|nr:testican-3 [Neoarius graeffei]
MLRAVMLLVCVCAAAVITGAAARQDNANFLDDKWLTARWDKFRDEPASWNPGKPLDQALDPAKDPCLKIKCGRHKQCVTEDYKTPTCVSQMRLKSMSLKPVLVKCKRCPLARPAPVCATDRHTYSTECQMEYQACISGTQIAVKCPGQCPCVSEINKSVGKKECSDAELNKVASRLRDWSRDVHESSKKLKLSIPDMMDMTKAPVCKGSLGWMFTRLDMNFDLHLDQSELAGLGSETDDVCTETFLRSCDLGRDQLISNKEWCSCFQRYQESPCQSEIINIHKQQARKKLLGQYVPSCDEDGFYKPHQCHGSNGQCWCVDRYGNKVPGSRRMGPAECVLEGSGDFGSGDLLLSDDEDDVVLNDQGDMGDDEYDEDDDDSYLS